MCYNLIEGVIIMTTITIRSTDENKDFLKKIAEFNGTSLSDYIITAALEKAEEQADYQEYLKIMTSHRPQDDISLEEMEKELGI